MASFFRKAGRSKVGARIGAPRGNTKQQALQVVSNLQNVIRSVDGATPEAIQAGLQLIFDKSQEYVPVDSGALKDSGYVEVRSGWFRHRGEVGYARDGNPPYAIYVHEMVDNQHQPPTRAKFLQAAIEEELARVPAEMVRVIQNATGIK